jgi:uncharacterized protein YkwD
MNGKLKKVLISSVLIAIYLPLWFIFIYHVLLAVGLQVDTSKNDTHAVPHLLDKALIYGDINTERVRAGLQPLLISTKLEESACLKVDDMIARGYWEHNTPDGIKPWTFINEVGYSYKSAGENLAYGYNDEQETVNGWMSSPGHRANLLGNYTQMGICTRLTPHYQGKDNQTVVVNHFATPI